MSNGGMGPEAVRALVVETVKQVQTGDRLTAEIGDIKTKVNDLCSKFPELCATIEAKTGVESERNTVLRGQLNEAKKKVSDLPHGGDFNKQVNCPDCVQGIITRIKGSPYAEKIRQALGAEPEQMNDEELARTVEFCSNPDDPRCRAIRKDLEGRGIRLRKERPSLA